MSAVIRTIQCYPNALDYDWLHKTDPNPAYPGTPDHEHCPGGFHVEGILGGWHCPCPCHREPKIAN